MFNFLGEIKKELKLPEIDGSYNLVNVNGKALYAEGQRGLVSLSENLVMFKVKGKIVSVFGSNLKLKELSSQTLSIVGEIEKIEVV